MTETFAFIDLGSGDRGLADCIAGLNNTKWKGKVVRVKYRGKDYSKFFSVKYTLHTSNNLSCQMKLQQAKESFMERLARERRERESEGWVFHFSAEQSLNTPSQVD